MAKKPVQSKSDLIRGVLQQHPDYNCKQTFEELGTAAKGLKPFNFYDVKKRMGLTQGRKKVATKKKHRKAMKRSVRSIEVEPVADLKELQAENRRLKIAVQGLSATLASLL